MQRTAFRCTMCGREFENKDSLEQHEKEAHPQSRTMEGVGNAGRSEYGKEGTLKEDTPAEFGEQKSSYYCSICSTEFESQEKLDSHLKTHQYA